MQAAEQLPNQPNRASLLNSNWPSRPSAANDQISGPHWQVFQGPLSNATGTPSLMVQETLPTQSHCYTATHSDPAELDQQQAGRPDQHEHTHHGKPRGLSLNGDTSRPPMGSHLIDRRRAKSTSGAVEARMPTNNRHVVSAWPEGQAIAEATEPKAVVEPQSAALHNSLLHYLLPSDAMLARFQFLFEDVKVCVLVCENTIGMVVFEVRMLHNRFWPVTC